MKIKRFITKISVSLAGLLMILSAPGCSELQKEIFDLNLGKLLRPISISFSGISSESVIVTWTGKASFFELEYGTTEDFSGEVKKVENIKSTSQAVTDLTEMTTYYFRVRGLSSREGVEPSEFSAPSHVRTLLEPRLPNVAATDRMEYTVDPWSVTSTITVQWGAEGIDPEEVNSMRLTPADDPSGVLTFPVNETEWQAQRKEVSEGVKTSTAYTIDLMYNAKVRGSTVITTKPGPTPLLTVLTNLDFTTNPVSATASVSWTLYYVEPAALSKVVITPAAGGAAAADIAVTPAHIAGGGIRDIPGLRPSTEYKAELLASDHSVIATQEFKTVEGLPDDIIVAYPGDNLSAIISDPDRSSDMVYLVPGVYTLVTDDPNPVISRNLILTSADPARTTVKTARVFTVAQGSYERVEFSNLTFECSSYLMQFTGSVAFSISNLLIDNCVVNLNSSATGNSSLLSAGNTNTGSFIGDYTVRNSTVFANRAQAQNIVFNGGSTNKITTRSLNLLNSTFSNCGRGLIASPLADDYPIDITIDHCTLYGMQGNSANNSIVDIRTKGPSPKSVRLSNSIVHFGGTTSRWFTFASATEFPSVSADNVYYFSSQTPAYGNAAYGITAQLTPYGATDAQLWVNPQLNPVSAGASFRIKDNDVLATQEGKGTTLGDQRW